MPHLLEVQNLTTIFAGDYGSTTSVDHISFHVDQGEVVCIVGDTTFGAQLSLKSTDFPSSLPNL